MRLGPDHKIYYSDAGGNQPQAELSVIMDPDNFNGAVFEEYDVNLSGRFPTRGLPNIFLSWAYGDINVYGNPGEQVFEPEIIDDTTICVGTDVQLYAQQNVNYNYLWTPPTGLDDPTSRTPTASPDGNIEYQVMMYNACDTGYSTVTIMIDDPNMILNESQSVSESESYTLYGEGGGTYQWTSSDPNAVISDPSASTTDITITDDTTYFYLEVITEEGCLVYDTIILTKKYNLFIPTAFTPNEDGINDEYTVLVSDFSEYELSIFDRYGKQMFSSDSPSNKWDGTFNGKTVAAGVYVYSLKIEFYEKSPVMSKGNITVIH